MKDNPDFNYIRHKVWYGFGRLFCPLFLSKYKFSTDKLKSFDGPTLVLANHLTESDLFMLAEAFRPHMYFVCGEHLLRSKIGGFLKHIAGPISAPRGAAKISTVREILRHIRRGHSVAMFPEGCRSFNGETLPIQDSAAKLVKSSGASLITYKIHGGYFIAPRWAYNFRKGKAEGEIVHRYTPDEIKAMSTEELSEHINSDLYENAYEYQKEKQYRYTGKNPAEGLENYLIICPECGSYDSMVTKDNTFRCKCCGTGGIYDEYGMLQGEKLSFHSVYDWGKWIKQRFSEDLSKDSRPLLFTEENVSLCKLLPNNGKEDLGTGTLKIFRDALEFSSGEFKKELQFSDIADKSLLYYGKTFLFTDKTGYYKLIGENFHAIKLDMTVDIYRNSKSTEQGL